MAKKPDVDSAVREGRRERKRRQTRERIEAAALKLFLERGFDATTIEDITEAADVSKRSFFDYFPSKEDVVTAWQDGFARELIGAIAAQPEAASVVEVIEAAVNSALRTAMADPQSLALAALIRTTPALSARDQLKYAKLARKLADALHARSHGSNAAHLRLDLLAAAVVTMLRIGGERWAQSRQDISLEEFARDLFDELWAALADLGEEVRQRP
ncbi:MULTISPECIES: TetR family transcriptional regulator [unclassified Rhizobium]|jgi:AcrR family transcriptional regulator|uniref:TetR family transcriptional regulator n=1 Tax=unclassified Rhizobium TaxID=2613769 RepID=UPI000645E03E|nr:MULTISPECIES: TetR family transcriptional regulator [unclassified Rhizobium]MBN8950041.1 TetR family transcriptional regulator [Rhizobium tropici]OJY62594.1 MAG: TetR family transcriptional regulator [Rhizobium sp. 60-20]RKD74663.1 TetR family transcriptional regulator [Rhizobium sp. WW_1]